MSLLANPDLRYYETVYGIFIIVLLLSCACRSFVFIKVNFVNNIFVQDNSYNFIYSGMFTGIQSVSSSSVRQSFCQSDAFFRFDTCWSASKHFFTRHGWKYENWLKLLRKRRNNYNFVLYSGQPFAQIHWRIHSKRPFHCNIDRFNCLCVPLVLGCVGPFRCALPLLLSHFPLRNSRPETFREHFAIADIQPCRRHRQRPQYNSRFWQRTTIRLKVRLVLSSTLTINNNVIYFSGSCIFLMRTRPAFSYSTAVCDGLQFVWTCYHVGGVSHYFKIFRFYSWKVYCSCVSWSRRIHSSFGSYFSRVHPSRIRWTGPSLLWTTFGDASIQRPFGNRNWIAFHVGPKNAHLFASIEFSNGIH